MAKNVNSGGNKPLRSAVKSFWTAAGVFALLALLPVAFAVLYITLGSSDSGVSAGQSDRQMSIVDAQRDGGVSGVLPKVGDESVELFANRRVDIVNTPGKGGSRCTTAFVVQRGRERLAVTAGHCLQDAKSTVDGFGTVDKVSRHYSPDKVDPEHSDYGLFDAPLVNRVSVGVDAPIGTMPTSAKSFDILGVVAPKVGEPVCAYGDSSGWRCGAITRVNDTTFVVAGMGSVMGDSGGGAYSGNSVVGVTSSAIGGDSTLFQRADVIMEREGVELAK